MLILNRVVANTFKKVPTAFAKKIVTLWICNKIVGLKTAT